MSAGTYNINIEQGSTYTQDFIWSTGQPAVPVDVTGYSARMHIRADLTAATPYYQLSTTNGRIVMGTTDGKITLVIPANDSSVWLWTGGVYDLELISPSATPVVTRLLKGTVLVDDEVTRQ